MYFMLTWRVSNLEHGCALLDFLSERLRISRRRAKALLDAHAVFVNRRRVWMARHVLRAGDMVESPQPENSKPTARTLPILYRDSEYIVVNKPAGMRVDGAGGIEVECRRRCGSEAIVLVHRLDKDTSGCLILAKNATARDRLVPLFEQRQVIKVYDVLVAGLFPENIKTITKDVDGQQAITHVMRLSANAHASHLRVRIETGRTHQIRKHMAALRHPVLGDRLYATGALDDPLWREVPRQMLHASQIAFRNPITGVLIRVRAPLPPDFMLQRKKLKLI